MEQHPSVMKISIAEKTQTALMNKLLRAAADALQTIRQPQLIQCLSCCCLWQSSAQGVLQLKKL